MYRCDRRYSRWDGFVWGMGLIGVGVVFLLHYLGLVAWREWSVWWPGLVIFVGLMRLFTARTPKRIGSSITTLLLGGWFLVAANDWHGLGWRHSWPLALVAMGVGTVVRAIA